MKFKMKVVDSGVGISEENMSKLFIDFGKLEEHEDINHEGTGLGLSICKQLIIQMGGNVNVQSKVNEGTTFDIQMNSLCKFHEITDQELKDTNNIQILQNNNQQVPIMQNFDADMYSDDYTYRCMVANKDISHTNELEKILNQC